MRAVNIVMMAKPAVPGRVKTRLVGDELGPGQAAAVHALMLGCGLERAKRCIVSDGPVVRVLAVDESIEAGSSDPSIPLSPDATATWRRVDQGPGDLGQRMVRVWRAVGGGRVVFLGADSPDVPGEVLGSIFRALDRSDVAVGPVGDGGYWTLAARAFYPELLTGIDWGTCCVYDQTVAAAEHAHLRVAALAPWHDVDLPEDLRDLRQRISRTQDPVLACLRSQLDQVFRTSVHEHPNHR